MKSRRAIVAIAALLSLFGLTLALSGCGTAGYYWQSVSGHLQLMRSARPVQDWLSQADTREQLRQRLALSQRIRDFAVSELKLPDNGSYRRFADLHRGAVVWNVVAAPVDSLTLKTWCFPVVGCVGYRGYFDQADAQREGQELKATGLEVSVYGVPAYSTLGWFDDPLLSTFINYPEGELARIIFHELAHQVAYASGDTTFNESFATTVERIGGARWLTLHGSEAAKREYAAFDARRMQFRALSLATRTELKAIYTDAPAAERLARKAQAMAKFRADYEQLKRSWGSYAGYDGWVAQANNAAFGAQAAYDAQVPVFEALFQREGGDWLRFYDAVKRLADMNQTQRQLAMKEITGA